MKEKIIGLILVIGVLAYIINATSWGEIKYRHLKDSVLHSKECKIIDSATKTDILMSVDFDCKYNDDVLSAADYLAKVQREYQCSEEFRKFDNKEKVLIEADTNCNTDTFFYSVVTENGEIVSRELVMTSDGKIKEFVNLGRGIDNYGTYDVHFFHTR